jgi:hypothetical protein
MLGQGEEVVMFELFAGLGVLYLFYWFACVMVGAVLWAAAAAIALTGLIVGLFFWVWFSLTKGVCGIVERKYYTKGSA